MSKIPVGVLGATGMVGQHYLRLLDNHPWFYVNFLAASEHSCGKSYAEATEGRFHLHAPLSQSLMNLPVHSITDLKKAKDSCRLIFSALDTAPAKIHEELYAAYGLPVVSNASAHRHTPDVPLIIPEINAHHLDIIKTQQKNRGWKEGFIVVKPNCSLQSYLTPLYAIHKHFPIKKVILTTMQAVSGAGWPGISSFNILDNVIPYISGEEEKSEREPLKILGSIANGQIMPSSGPIFSAHCNRVSVLDGHTACVSLDFTHDVPSQAEILSLWHNFKGLNLPSAPAKPIIYTPIVDRPQPRLDRDHAMAVTVGRLRPCPVFAYRFVGLSHNTVRGAAGGGILNAELLTSLNYC